MSARGATVSPATTAAPREAWSARANPGGDQGGGEPLDEWDFAERGPLAKLKRKQLTEVAREKAKMGIYVDESELGGFKDPRPPHLKPLPNDSDFVGPDSYPRRQRDWIGYYVAGVLCFASFVVGVHGGNLGVRLARLEPRLARAKLPEHRRDLLLVEGAVPVRVRRIERGLDGCLHGLRVERGALHEFARAERRAVRQVDASLRQEEARRRAQLPRVQP